MLIKGKRLPEFWRRVSIVLMGTVVAQAIPLAILPILTRILPPEAIGQYAMWLGIATVSSVAATLRLDIAIFNARTPEEVGALIKAAIISAISISGVLVIVVSLIRATCSGCGTATVIGAGAYEAAAMAAVLAISQTVLAAYVYRARFARQAFARMTLAGTVALAQLGAVLAGYGVPGMIVAQLVTSALVVSWFLFDIREDFLAGGPSFSVKQFAATMRANWRFPVYSMPGDFVSSFAAQLPLFVLGGRFGPAAAGQYSLTSRTLSAPVGILASSVLSVFKEEAARQYREHGSCLPAYRRALRSLAVLGLAPFLAVLFFSVPLFEFVFGDEWGYAGRIAMFLSPMFYLKFIASPLSYTMYLANRQLHDLLWQLALLAMTASAFYFSRSMDLAVMAYSAGYCALYVVYLRMSYLAAKGTRL